MSEAEFTAHLGVVHALLWHYARALSCTRRVPAEDLYQHAALSLWADRHKAAEHPSPSRWFAHAARWAMLALCRGERRLASELDDVANADLLTTADPDLDEFAALVGMLPAEVQGLAVGLFRDNTPVAELASAVGLTADTARRRLSAALAELRPRLAG